MSLEGLKTEINVECKNVEDLQRMLEEFCSYARTKRAFPTRKMNMDISRSIGRYQILIQREFLSLKLMPFFAVIYGFEIKSDCTENFRQIWI